MELKRVAKAEKGQKPTISENLSRLMKLNKISESKLAQSLNIPVMTVRRLLSGETTDPRVFTLKMLADYFNVTIDHLMGLGTVSPHESVHDSKPLFVPLLEWDAVKTLSRLELDRWEKWIPITVGRNLPIDGDLFALKSRPSMSPRFEKDTIFILNPNAEPLDGDLVLVNFLKNDELALRELFIDPPEWQLYPITQGSSVFKYSLKEHQIKAVVFLTLFYNRKVS